MRNPKKEYRGRIEDYPLENYPDYEPGKPPRTELLERIHYLHEVERIWGKNWGGCGIGKLREVALIRPHEQEVNPLWEKEPNFFLLRRARINLPRLKAALEDYAQLLEGEGVKVHWMEVEDTMGAYGPMRKMFMGGAILVVRGGAILPRYGQTSMVRGRNINFLRFLTSIGCPILHMVHGSGICEPGVFVPLAEDVVVAGKGSTANDDGLEQVLAVLYRSGIKEVLISHHTTLYEDFEAGGEFHMDMVLGVVDLGVAVIYPGYLDYQTFRWLREKGFKLIEIPKDEHHQFYPANLVILEPGRVIMPAGAKETIRRVRQAGVEVIEFDTSGLMGGTNGLRCVTMLLLRDPGPRLEDMK